MKATKEPKAIVLVYSDITLVDIVGPLRHRPLKDGCLA
jgi:hypothetical protein